MSAWLESYRGSVAPWECDMTEHFTIGYYFDRLGQAGLEIADRLGLGEIRRAALGARRFAVRFARELRAGAGFHIESAPIGLDPALRLGHRIVDSANGAIVTWVEEVWEVPLPPALATALAGRIAEWQGPAPEPRPEPAGAVGIIATARGRAMPADLDESGVFSLGAFVHRFTDACLQTMAAIGADAAYMQAERRGYSTFELALEIDDAPRLGDPYLVETGIAHLGNSSIRLVHHMSDPRSGRRLARLGQFGVQLDLDRRRPAALPQEIRERAARLLIAPA
ncbi:MAG TPA: thioesterase family protein [Stellaceae bacterium]|nr:thioesterase family protein [Stellaceae bacterium]